MEEIGGQRPLDLRAHPEGPIPTEEVDRQEGGHRRERLGIGCQGRVARFSSSRDISAKIASKIETI